MFIKSFIGSRFNQIQKVGKLLMIALKIFESAILCENTLGGVERNVFLNGTSYPFLHFYNIKYFAFIIDPFVVLLKMK